MQWEPTAEKYLAQGTLDKKLVVWDVETEQVKFNATLPGHVVQIEWNKQNENSLLTLLNTGKLSI